MKKNNKLMVILAIVVITTTFLLLFVFDSPSQQLPSEVPQQVLSDTNNVANPNDVVAPNSSGHNFVILILSLTTLCSISISFYLYKWRKILLMNPEMVVPEKWAEILISLGRTVNNSTVSVEKNLHSIVSATNDNTGHIKNMTETYMELQNALDSKDNELKRYKANYDAYLYKKFIKRFIRIDQSLTEFMVDDASENLGFVKRLFEDALDESGVSIFVPSLGDDYRTAYGIADHPKIEVTDDESLDFKISEIIECGYKIEDAEDGGIIFPSKVKIYKFKKEA